MSKLLKSFLTNHFSRIQYMFLNKEISCGPVFLGEMFLVSPEPSSLVSSSKNEGVGNPRILPSTVETDELMGSENFTQSGNYP
jgi:hypothetical protein